MKSENRGQQGSWLSKTYFNLFLVIALLGLIPAFLPAVFKAKDICFEAGREQGRTEILRLPRANYDTVIRSLDQFREFFLQTPQVPHSELHDAFMAQRWSKLRINMAQKYINEEIQSAFSPYDVDQNGHILIRTMIKHLREISDDYSNAIFARHTAQEIAQAKIDFEKEFYFLDSPEPVSYASLASRIVGGYLLFALWTGVYFIPKARHYSFKLRYEFISGRLVLAMLACPVMFLAYPWGDPKQQIRKFVRNVASLASFAMCYVGPASMTFAKNIGHSQKRKMHPPALVCNEFWRTNYMDRPPDLIEQTIPTSTDGPKDTPVSDTMGQRQLNVSTVLLPRYIGLAGGEFSHFPVLQTNISLSFATGFSFGIWTSKSMTGQDLSPNFGNEVDLSADYGRTWRSLSVDVGFTYIAASPITRIAHGDVVQFRANIGRRFNLKHGNVTPHMLVRHFIRCLV